VDNYVFDIGDTTREAIGNLEDAGPADEGANGNGSLMRIAPLVFYLRGSPITKRFEITKKSPPLLTGIYVPVSPVFTIWSSCCGF